MKNGDPITIDARSARLTLDVQRRGTAQAPREVEGAGARMRRGAYWRSTRELVSSASLGAVTD